MAFAVECIKSGHKHQYSTTTILIFMQYFVYCFWGFFFGGGGGGGGVFIFIEEISTHKLTSLHH